MRDNCDLDPVIIIEDGKTWLASRYILEAELTEFAARLVVICNRKWHEGGHQGFGKSIRKQKYHYWHEDWEGVDFFSFLTC